MVENFKIQQLQELYAAGFCMASDRTYHHFSNIQEYEKKPKPMYTKFQVLHHDNMIRKGMICCEVAGFYYITAKSFISAMRRKSKEKSGNFDKI